LKQLTQDPTFGKRVKVVFKHFPLGFHKEAMPAAIASMAAHQQGKFWEMADKMFANQRELTEDNFKKWAGEIGLDMAKFEAALKDPAVAKLIQDDMADARKAGVRGTPSIYLNGRQYQAAGGYAPEAFKGIVDKYFPAK
jgi:protein-disulfide isomerase